LVRLLGDRADDAIFLGQLRGLIAAMLVGVTRTIISGGTPLRLPYCSASSAPM
jgi:hypothetical protein